eukprot:TRINITY_DN1775_c0_g1_i1.p1 TRINITY_DN1775_c0_g1~~TRINITY_DN1775_c0_g1_i1.p1  ORF type:complete len:879 (+),score=198.96 TRINITY_DN1775_c0_g1_i1:366-3002(+)
MSKVTPGTGIYSHDVEKTKRRVKNISSLGRIVGKRSRFVINPNAPHRRYWDVLILVALTFTAVVTPFEVAFHDDTTPDNILEWIVFMLNRTVDTCFAVDMIFNFFLCYFDEKRSGMVADTLKITKRYVKGWFIIDFVSIFPFDMLGFVLQSDTLSKLKVLRLIRLLRLMKLLRIVRASRIISRWESHINVSFSKLALGKFILVLCFAAHWVACLWGLMVSFQGDDSEPVMQSDNWVASYGLVNPDDILDVYFAALYWSVMTLTTIGFGDIVAVTTLERLMAVVCMLIGGSMYAYIVGAVCSILNQLDEATQEYRRTMDQLNAYMKEMQLPPSMQRQLRVYFQFCKKNIRARYFQDVLSKMSPMLRGQVATYSNRTWVSKIRFFQHVPPEEKEILTTEIAMAMRPQAFPPGEAVIVYGERATTMHVLQRGICSRNGVVISSGTVVGEDVVLQNTKRHYTVRTLTYTDVSTLQKEDLTNILDKPELENSRKIVRRFAIKLAFRKAFVVHAKAVKAMREAAKDARNRRLSVPTPSSINSDALAAQRRISNRRGTMPSNLESDSIVLTSIDHDIEDDPNHDLYIPLPTGAGGVNLTNINPIGNHHSHHTTRQRIKPNPSMKHNFSRSSSSSAISYNTDTLLMSHDASFAANNNNNNNYNNRNEINSATITNKDGVKNINALKNIATGKNLTATASSRSQHSILSSASHTAVSYDPVLSHSHSITNHNHIGDDHEELIEEEEEVVKINKPMYNAVYSNLKESGIDPSQIDRSILSATRRSSLLRSGGDVIQRLDGFKAASEPILKPPSGLALLLHKALAKQDTLAESLKSLERSVVVVERSLMSTHNQQQASVEKNYSLIVGLFVLSCILCVALCGIIVALLV